MQDVATESCRSQRISLSIGPQLPDEFWNCSISRTGLVAPNAVRSRKRWLQRDDLLLKIRLSILTKYVSHERISPFQLQNNAITGCPQHEFMDLRGVIWVHLPCILLSPPETNLRQKKDDLKLIGRVESVNIIQRTIPNPLQGT